MSRLLGDDREVFINLMVSTINRVSKTPHVNQTEDNALGRLYGSTDGDAGWRNCTEEDFKKRLKYFLDDYCETLKRLAPSTSTVSFALKKGTTDPDIGWIFCMVFATTSQKHLNNMKAAMMPVTQRSDELSFTDFYHLNNPGVGHDFFEHLIEREDEAAYGRKTTDEVEARAIWNEFHGRKVSLAEIRTFFLEQTPFAWHTKPLKLLEDTFKIMSVETLDDQSRIKGAFCSKVPPTPDDVDPKYGNSWTISFSNQDLAASLQNLKREDDDILQKLGSFVIDQFEYHCVLTVKQAISRVPKIFQGLVRRVLKLLENEGHIFVFRPPAAKKDFKESYTFRKSSNALRCEQHVVSATDDDGPASHAAEDDENTATMEVNC